MTSLPYLPPVDQTLCGQKDQPIQLHDLADFEAFQAFASSAFDATLNAAKEVQNEFCSLTGLLNSVAKNPLSGLNKEKILQRLVIETVFPKVGPRFYHISLGQQFNRIFLKRRKVQLKCVVYGPTNTAAPDEEIHFRLLVCTSLLPVKEVKTTSKGAPLLSGQTTHQGPLTVPIRFSFRFNQISAELPGGVLTLVVTCSRDTVEPLVIPNITVKALKKKFKFTAD